MTISLEWEGGKRRDKKKKRREKVLSRLTLNEKMQEIWRSYTIEPPCIEKRGGRKTMRGGREKGNLNQGTG